MSDDAMKRAGEMFQIPMNQLPPLAIDLAKDMCRRYGGCSEVLLTAYAVYAQVVEGLPCADPNYVGSPEDVAFLHRKMTSIG